MGRRILTPGLSPRSSLSPSIHLVTPTPGPKPPMPSSPKTSSSSQSSLSRWALSLSSPSPMTPKSAAPLISTTSPCASCRWTTRPPSWDIHPAQATRGSALWRTRGWCWATQRRGHSPMSITLPFTTWRRGASCDRSAWRTFQQMRGKSCCSFRSCPSASHRPLSA